MKYFLIFILSFLVNFAVNAQESFKVGNLLFEVEDIGGHYELIVNGDKSVYRSLTVRPVLLDKATNSYKGVFLVPLHDQFLHYFYQDANGLTQIERLDIEIKDILPTFQEDKLVDGNFKQDIVKITYETASEGKLSLYEKALIFYTPETDKFFSHYYVTKQRADSHPPVHKLDGENVRLFRTGGSFIEHPFLANSELIKIESGEKAPKGYFRRPTPVKVKLPDHHKRIKDFTVLTLDDFTDEEIKKSKEFVGSDDFYEIMEALVEGSAAVLGESGEGKTFLAEMFYIAALAGYVPGYEIQEVLLLTKDSLTSKTQFVGQSADKLKALKEFYQQGNGKRLVFADEIHTLQGAGTSSNNSVDHLQVLKSDMARGTFKMLGTTTLDEFNALVGGDVALERRFFKVMMTPKTHDEIVNAVKYNAKSRDINISDELIEKIILFSEQFDVTGVQPAKAVKLAIKSIAKLKTRLPGQVDMSEDIVIKSVSELYNSDVKMLDPTYALEKTAQLETILNKKVIGLQQAKESLIEASRQRFLGMTDTNKPPLRMMLMGPPGTGKSYIAKVYAEAMGFKTVIISMNKYRGHHNSDVFLNEIASNLRNYPDAVLILDEFEKASDPVKLSSLQMLNDGEFKQLEKLPGSQQTRSIKISSKRAGFMLTSNLGDSAIKDLFTSILQIELEKTENVAKAEAEASRVFQKTASKAMLEELLEKLGFNTAVMDRMDHIIAVTPPNRSEFRANIELYTKLFFKDYEKRMGLKVTLRNYRYAIDRIMTHYKPGHSNRDAQKMIEQILKPQISKQLNAESLKLKKLSLKMPLDEMEFVDPSPQTTINLKKLISMHELHGHWLVNYMLYGENVSNYVTIIPGKGYLGYVRPKVNHDVISETMETFTGMFKKVLVLEAGYRAEKIISGVTGRGAGSINRKDGTSPSDDLGKIDQFYDRWINNNFFKGVIENQTEKVKTEFKLQMADIIREATDYIIKKGLANKVGNEAVEKLLKEGKLHGEYLDEYANKLSKALGFSPEKILDEAIDYAQKVLEKQNTEIGTQSETTSTVLNSTNDLIDQIREKINDEKLFFNAKCNDYYTNK